MPDDGTVFAYPELEPGHSWAVTTTRPANNKKGYKYHTVPIEEYKREAKEMHLHEEASGSTNHVYRGSPHTIHHNPVNWERGAHIHIAKLRHKGYNDEQVNLALQNTQPYIQAWQYIRDGGIIHFPDGSVHHPATMTLERVIAPGEDTNVGHMQAVPVADHLRFSPSLTHTLHFQHSWPAEMPSGSAGRNGRRRGQRE